MSIALLIAAVSAAPPEARRSPLVCVMNANGVRMNDVGYPRVHGATVALYADGSRPGRYAPIFDAVTGPDGCVPIDLADVPEGTLRLRVSAPGYASKWAPLAFRRGDPFYVFGDRNQWVAWVLVHPGLRTATTHLETTLDRRSLDALPKR